MKSVQTLARGLDVLTAVATSTQPIGVSDVSRVLDINKASVARFLATLAEKRFVERDQASGRYCLGPAALGLVPRQTFESELIARAQKYLEATRDLTTETVGLYLREGLDRVCVHSVESKQELRRSLRAGDRKRLTLGSTGRTFLAFMPSREAQSVIDVIGLTPETPQTTVDRAAFLAELADIRKRGAAMTFGQTILGVAGLSIPVLDANERAVAVVSISGPSGRWTPNQMDAVVEKCKHHGRLIAAELGLATVPVDDDTVAS